MKTSTQQQSLKKGHGLKTAKGAILVCIRDGLYYQVETRQALSVDYHLAFGFWRISKIYNEGGGPRIEDIRDATFRLAKDHRETIKSRLIQMGASRVSELAKNQLKTYYNFLTSLK
jgi:hypothetical protein